MTEFSPVQLDALEDALEALETTGIPADLADDNAVVERLGEYEALLQLSREALPLVDVPDGVLAGVLAEARAEPPVVVAPADGDQAGASDVETTPWWKRFGVWLPALSVAASAALVLVIVRGSAQQSEPAAVVATAATPSAQDKKGQKEKGTAPMRGPLLEQAEELRAAADNDGEDAEPAAAYEGGGLRRGQALGGTVVPSVADAAEPEPEPESEDAEGEAPAAAASRSAPGEAGASKPRDARRASTPSAGATKPSKSKPAAPPSKGAPVDGGNALDPFGSGGSEPSKEAPASAKKQDADKAPVDERAVLTEADGERRAGRCSKARRGYTRLEDSKDAGLRARALAGLGLCSLRAGDDKAAEALFARARGVDPGVSAFIDAERGKSTPSPKKASRKKKR